MFNNSVVDLSAVSSIEATPLILDVICNVTGMGFAAVARVTDDQWIACSVRDDIAFGLKPGGELKVETTICNEIRQSREAVIIDHAAEDEIYCGHPTPAMYGFQSYISVPIILQNDSFFGTLCAIDPRPARLRKPEIVGMFRLFAELIALHLSRNQQIASERDECFDEHQTAALQEQFIAVLGQDPNKPLMTISAGTRISAMLARTGEIDARGATARRGLIEKSDHRHFHLVTVFPVNGEMAPDSRATVLLPVADLLATPSAGAVFIDLFGLTPAEDRLAKALMQGKTLRLLTTEFGVQMPTLRAQVQSVLHKCGVRRQVDLVRVLLKVTEQTTVSRL